MNKTTTDSYYDTVHLVRGHSNKKAQGKIIKKKKKGQSTAWNLKYKLIYIPILNQLTNQIHDLTCGLTCLPGLFPLWSPSLLIL